MTDGPLISANAVTFGENWLDSGEIPNNRKEVMLESLKSAISESEVTVAHARACYASGQAQMEDAKAALKDARDYHEAVKSAFDALSAGVSQQEAGSSSRSNIQRLRQLSITKAQEQLNEALAELTSAKENYRKCCLAFQVDRLAEQLASKQLETLLVYQKNIQDLNEESPFQRHVMDGQRKTMKSWQSVLSQGGVHTIDSNSETNVFFGTVALETTDVPCAILSSGECWILHGGQQLPYEGEYQLLLYKGDVEWVAASLGTIPEGRIALRGGAEEDGSPWFHAKYGYWPAKTGVHLGGARYGHWDDDVLVQFGYSILCWKRGFEPLNG